MLKTVILLLCLALTGCAGMPAAEPHHSHLTPHFAGSLFQVTEKGYYSVEILIKSGPFAVGKNTLDLIVHKDVEGNRDVEGARIKVTPWMPMMGHGVHAEPVITERGAGVYSAENVVANMEGDWELQIEIQGDAGTDSVVIPLNDVRMRHSEGHTHEDHMAMIGHEGISQPPAGTDLTTVRSSGRNLFRGSFVSLEPKVPINRIHAWELSLNLPSGQPLRAAKILVDGQMPEHGHGMPTVAQMTREIRDGVYLIEGMKFNMPGWWVVTFRVETASGEMDDVITFNLDLK